MNSLPTFPAVPSPARRAVALAPLFALLLVGLAHAAGISTPMTKHGTPVSHGKKAARAAKSAKPTATGGLSATEKKLTAAVDAHAGESLALLERVVNVNSGTMNLDGVRAVSKMFEPELTALGFSTQWVDGATWGRAGDLIARRVPGGAAAPAEHRRPGVSYPSTRPAAKTRVTELPKILLIGHLDTVFEKDSPFQQFKRLSDSTASGPGVCDMKGGDVVMLLALRALKDAGLLDRLAITVYLAGDEERAGDPHALARRDLQSAADWADVAIGFEDGSGNPREALIARRGASSWTLDVTGKTYHSSQIFTPEAGYGAVFEAARILDAFRDSLAGQRYLTFNPGTVLGGTDVTWDSVGSRGTAFGKTNVVADRAVVNGDLRALTPDQFRDTQRTMRAIVARHLAHTDATISFDEGYPPLPPTDGNRRLLAMYDRASRDLGQGGVEAVDPSRAGAADVAWCDGRVDMAIDGVGLMGSGAHSPDEVADLRTLPTQAKRMAVLLSRLAERKGK